MTQNFIYHSWTWFMFPPIVSRNIGFFYWRVFCLNVMWGESDQSEASIMKLRLRKKITKYLIKTKRLLFPIIYYFFGEWRTKTLRLSYWLWNLVVRDPRKLNHIQNKNTSLFYIFTLINLLRKIQFWSDTLTC